MNKHQIAGSVLLALPVSACVANETASAVTITIRHPVEVIQPDSNLLRVDGSNLQQQVSSTSDTASLLKNLPGVNMQNGGGVSSLPMVRGLADDRLRIKVDGMDLISACGNHMNPPLSYIDPAQVASAQVYAGISPVSMGGDSIGGAIIVNSASPVFAASADSAVSSAQAGLSYRSNGNAFSASIGGNLASHQLSLAYQGSYAKSGNYSAADSFKAAGPAASNTGWLDGDEVGSTRYKSINHLVSLGLKQDNHLLEMQVGVQDIPYQAWPNQRMDMTGNDSTRVNLEYTGEFAWGQLQAQLYNERTRHAMQFYEDKLFWYGPNATAPATDGIPCTPAAGMNGCAAGMPMDTRGDNTGLSLKSATRLSQRDTLNLGLELQDYTLDDWWEPSGKSMWPNTFWNINNGERDRRAVYAEIESQWDAQWLTQAGIRYERVSMDAGTVQGYNTTSAQYAAESAAFNAADRSRSDNNIDLTLLTRYRFSDSNELELGYARKNRSPNLYERYSWSTGGMAMRMINLAGDGNGYVGNLNLEPETAHTISAAWNLSDPDRWQLRISPYYTYVDDYIDARRCQSANANCGAANLTATNAFVYLQFVNQSARLYGLDISGQLSLAQNTGLGDFSLAGQLSYLRGKNPTSSDNLYNMMPLNALFTLSQQYGNWHNRLELELVDDKDRLSAVRNEIPTDGYGLLHLRSSYQWKKVNLDFGIENLLDRFYAHPLGGAYTGQGKTMSATGVAWGTPVPGEGRSLYAAVSYSF